MNVKELIAELIWKIRFLDPFFKMLIIFFKIKKAGKEEREEILRAVYDIRVRDDALTHLKKDWFVRLFVLSVLVVLGAIILIIL